MSCMLNATLCAGATSQLAASVLLTLFVKKLQHTPLNRMRYL